jgi:hypothetical protein
MKLPATLKRKLNLAGFDSYWKQFEGDSLNNLSYTDIFGPSYANDGFFTSKRAMWYRIVGGVCDELDDADDGLGFQTLEILAIDPGKDKKFVGRTYRFSLKNALPDEACDLDREDVWGISFDVGANLTPISNN